MKTLSCLLATLLLPCWVASQSPSQTLRGKVYDKESLTPLIGANITIEKTMPLLGSSTDENGNFRIESVPVGRRTLTISYLGYESEVIANVLVTTGKEVVLNIELTESLVQMKEVIVRAYNNKSQPNHDMAVASARSFSVEETSRYSSSLFDPARMAQNYAGVSFSGGSSDLFNEIIVRGNSPRGVLWRLEGIEIPNPNHFGSLGNSGGGISMLSSSLLSRSDFYTGAFPAEFGNATSGVFDLRLRQGNNERTEHSIMVGILGTEIATEGPMGAKGDASYLVNFRYSTLGILEKIGLSPAGDLLPEYGDLSFNIYLPKGKAGTLNIFGLGGKNRAYFEPEPDSSKWEFSDDNEGYNEKETVGTVGMAHKIIINNRSYLKTVAAASIDQYEDQDYTLIPAKNYREVVDFRDKFHNYHYRINSSFHQKINARHSFNTGLNASLHQFEFFSQEWEEEKNQFATYLQNESSAAQWQTYFQWKTRVNPILTLTGGLHFNYFGLSNHSSIEPRVAAKWSVSDDQSFHLALGLHSKPEHPAFYFVETSESGNQRTSPNKHLDYIKSVHAIAGWDQRFSKDFRIRAELYFQHLYDVPVEIDPDENGSLLNTLSIWDMLGTSQANNDGKGRNYGIDLTIEKNYSRNYYFLITASAFNSQFSTADGRWFNTRFNSKYQLNILGGREIPFKRSPHKTVGFNGKFIINGGDRTIPVDLENSRLHNEGVYVYDKMYTSTLGTYYRFDIGFKYQVNRPRTTHSIMLDVQNVTNHLNVGFQYYDEDKRDVETLYHTSLFPVLNYRVEF